MKDVNILSVLIRGVPFSRRVDDRFKFSAVIPRSGVKEFIGHWKQPEQRIILTTGMSFPTPP